MVWWGLLSWFLVGLGLAALLRLLPPWRRCGMPLSALGGMLGGLGGGVLATALGFGGLAAFDPRSLTTAALGALLVLLLLPLARRPAG
jgi:hypothetical protein